jgi:hypothetical protein
MSGWSRWKVSLGEGEQLIARQTDDPRGIADVVVEITRSHEALASAKVND